MGRQVYIIGTDAVPQKIVLDRGDTLDMVLVVLPGVSTDVSVSVDLVGAGASAEIYGLYLCTGDQQVRIRTEIRHESGGCTSRQLFKGLAGGSARASFDGLVYVRQDAQQTKAFQENHNILLSDSARVETRPQLEIYADDVECSHGATIGRLSEDELFYMRSRGIPEDEARVLQMISFLSPVVGRIPDEDLRTKIYDQLSQC